MKLDNKFFVQYAVLDQTLANSTTKNFYVEFQKWMEDGWGSQLGHTLTLLADVDGIELLKKEFGVTDTEILDMKDGYIDSQDRDLFDADGDFIEYD